MARKEREREKDKEKASRWWIYRTTGIEASRTIAEIANREMLRVVSSPEMKLYVNVELKLSLRQTPGPGH